MKVCNLRCLQALGAIGVGHSASAQFVDLGPGFVGAVSGDGSTVAGIHAPSAGFRWRPQVGFESIPLPTGYAAIDPGDVSFDGTVIVGGLTAGSSVVGFRWTESGGMHILPRPTTFGGYGGTAVSADGETVLIHSFIAPKLWTVAAGLQPIPIEGNWATYYAKGLSADGSLVAGYLTTLPNPQTYEWDFTWTAMGGAALFQGMRTVQGISPDGSVLFGEVDYDMARKPLNGAIQVIGTLPGTFGTETLDSNFDGTILVGAGWYSGGSIPAIPAIWTLEGGLERLEPYLAARGVVVPPEFQMTAALAISDDGRTIVGNGLVGDERHGFVAMLGSVLCYANCDGSTAPPALNVADFTCFLQRFAAGEPYANCDNSSAPPVLNVADFTCFLQQFAAGCP
jgi:uncharacterized membrane protein